VNFAKRRIFVRRGTLKSGLLFLALTAELVIGQATSAQFGNGGFEIGQSGLPPSLPWVVGTYMNPFDGVTLESPQTEAGLNLTQNGTELTCITNAPGGPYSEPDADLGTGGSILWPRYGNQCVLINQNGRNQNANSLSQTATVGAGMINPLDGQVHVSFVIAPILENPHHEPCQQPYYFIQLADNTQNTVLFEDFGALDDPDMPWKSVMTNDTEYDYTDWQLIDVVPSGTNNVVIGDQLTLTAIASGCSLGAHMGEMYMDGIQGSTNVIPGIYVTGTASQAAIAGDNLTYTFVYRNESASAETGVVLCFNTPQNTTFQSLNAPGLAAISPQAGTPGTVSCTLSNLAAGASGSFTVTVNVNPGTTGAITARNYYIYSNVETPLIGTRIITVLGNLNPIFLSGPTLTGNGKFSFSFTNVPGAFFTALRTTNVSLPFSRWSVLEGVVENPAGTYTFTDNASNREYFYSVRSP
jgi:uncharacterized repeat protein (TIGR01451 family)